MVRAGLPVAHAPQTAMELVEALSRRVGWAKSTT